jgi:hypothetical protein
MIATVIATLFSVSLVQAQMTYTWTNADSGNSNFNDADNWSPGGGPPLAVDSAIFNAGGWDINVTSRAYLKNITFSTPNLGTIDFSQQNSEDHRFGSQSEGTWDIGTGNILHVSSINRFELTQPVTKTGAGTFLLSQANIGTGNRGIAIVGGTVILNSANTPEANNSAWSVAAGATLGGNGGIRSTSPSVNGEADIFGTLQAGGSGDITDGQSNVIDAGSQFGTFSVDYTGDTTKGINMKNDSNLVIQFSADSSQNSQIDMLGGLFDIESGVTLDLFAPGAIAAGTYTLLSFDVGGVGNPAGTYAGTFSNLRLNNAAAGSDYSLAYDANSIDLVVIPEPGTFVLLGTLGCCLMLFHRRLS